MSMLAASRLAERRTQDKREEDDESWLTWRTASLLGPNGGKERRMLFRVVSLKRENAAPFVPVGDGMKALPSTAAYVNLRAVH